jgi:hypothetical protein
LKASGPARLRVGGGEGAQFAIRQGQATIDGANGNATLNQGDYLDVVDNTSPYNVVPLPQPDAWDTWNDQRDRRIDGFGSHHYLPSNIALVCDDLDANGSWHNDPNYGWIWAPRVTDAGWRPYSAGSWTWVEPFGWTWVANDSWGWAPYHYGTWVHASYGWSWCPGPARQYWSPAVVSFYQSGNTIAWCPLAPREVVYPNALSIGFHGGNWSLFFSIGSAAVYYPGPNNVCVARPWTGNYINGFNYTNNSTHITNVTNITNITVNHNTYVTNNNFVPSNARFQGGTQVNVQNFAGSRSAYQPVTTANLAVFSRGRAIGAPTGGSPIAGPQSVRVTPQAFTPTRTFTAARVPQAVINRPVFRTALPANVPRAASAPQQGQKFVSRATFNNQPAANRPVAQPRVVSRPAGNQPGSTRPGVTSPSQPVNVRGGNTAVSRPTPPTGTGHSAALDEYLRTRNAARGGNANNNAATTPGRNQPGPANNRPTNQDNPRTTNQPPVNTSRPAPSAPNTQRSAPDRPAPAQSRPAPSNPGRAVPTPPSANSYRPLHTRPANNPPAKGGNNNDKNPPKRSNDDRGRQ